MNRRYRIFITGSRTLQNVMAVENALLDFCSYFRVPFDSIEVVSGHTDGTERLGEAVAKRHSLPVALFPAGWYRYNRETKVLREAQIIDYADALIAITDRMLSERNKILYQNGGKNRIDNFRFIGISTPTQGFNPYRQKDVNRQKVEPFNFLSSSCKGFNPRSPPSDD